MGRRIGSLYKDSSRKKSHILKTDTLTLRNSVKMTKRELTNKAIPAVLIFLLYAFAGGCSSASKDDEQTLVKLNNEVITLSEFEEAFSSLDRYYGSRPLDKKNNFPVKAAFLKQMIEEKLILMEAKNWALPSERKRSMRRSQRFGKITATTRVLKKCSSTSISTGTNGGKR